MRKNCKKNTKKLYKTHVTITAIKAMQFLTKNKNC